MSVPYQPLLHSPILEENLRYITFDRAQIATFCQKFGIRKLSLFGSILREDFNPEHSDVDFLVEFLPETRIGYFELVRIENELSTMIGRKADLRTPQELSPYFRQKVIDEASPQYDQTPQYEPTT